MIEFPECFIVLLLVAGAGVILRFSIGRVHEYSMIPTFLPGDIIIIDKMCSKYKYEDVVVFPSPATHNLAIKRIQKLDYNFHLKSQQAFLVGDNLKSSIDSRKFGAIDVRDLKGKVVYNFSMRIK